MKLTPFRTFALSLLVGGAVAACGGSSKGADSPKAGPTCDEAASHAVEVMVAEAPEPPPAGEADMMRGVLATSCTEDAWSAELIQCIASATGRQTMCEEMFTAEQKEGLNRRIGEVMGGGGDDMDGERPMEEGVQDESADPCEGGEDW